MKYRYYTGMCIKHIMRPSLISENSGKTNILRLLKLQVTLNINYVHGISYIVIPVPYFLKGDFSLRGGPGGGK